MGVVKHLLFAAVIIIVKSMATLILSGDLGKLVYFVVMNAVIKRPCSCRRCIAGDGDNGAQCEVLPQAALIVIEENQLIFR